MLVAAGSLAVRKHPIIRTLQKRRLGSLLPRLPFGLVAVVAAFALAIGSGRFPASRLAALPLPWLLGAGAVVFVIEAARWGTGRWVARPPRPRAARTVSRAGRRSLDRAATEDGVLIELLGNLGLAVAITDRAGAVRCANTVASTLLERDGAIAPAALDPRGLFFGLPLEDGEQLAPLIRFFTREDHTARGEVTVAASRRRLSWTGTLLDGGEGLGSGRLFIIRDVTQERRFEALKGDFLATVSHELRTPLTALLGSLQLVFARAPGLAEGDRDLIAIGVKNTERLIRLINDLLDIDRLEQGTIPFEFTTLEIAELVQGAVTAVTPAFTERGLRVETELADDLPTIHGDRERLKQVVVNLLDNARKYAPASSTVVVRALGFDAGVQVEVCDQGVGIPVTEQPHVFERFWHADRSGPDAGAGLGLAICRAIVERHEGRIWINAETGGTTVSFFLPRSIFRAEEDADMQEVAAAPANARILVVEDDPDARAVMRASLEQCGYEVVEAPTGGHAVRLARREKPAAILLDLVLPDISGYDVLRILKNSGDTAALPVVVLSIEPERDLARRLGAWDALQKPIDFEAVRWTLVGALRSVGRRDGRLVMGVGPTVSRDLATLANDLEEDAHQVYRAQDLADLARWSAQHYPDVIVFDSDFITQTCAEVAETLRRIAIGRPIPLVFLGSAAPGTQAASGWVQLAKPSCKDDVIEAAETLLGAHGT
jgi:signal transduction histidine kinase/CheY-like chemotaxis protein